MSRHFSLPTVFRMTPNLLLRELFGRFPCPCYSLDWRRLGERQWEPLLRVLDLWPADSREFVESVLHGVFDLACETGLRAIRDAAAQLDVPELWDQLPHDGNLYHRALWTWLEHPDVFEQALCLHQVDRLHWWRKRNDAPRVEPRTDPDSLALLADFVSEALAREQGRGHRCSVEHFRRENGTDLFFCFPDDFVRTVFLHDESGELTTRPIRPTFEIVFAYRRETGTLEMSARIPGRLKQRIEDAFARIILDEPVGPRTPLRLYDLTQLVDRSFRIETDPEDVLHVGVRRVRIDLPDRTRIILEPGDGTKTPAEMIESLLNRNRITLAEIRVSQVTFQFRFGRTLTRRPGSMTFDVVDPDTCNLRSHRPERVEVATKYLRRWRIFCA